MSLPLLTPPVAIQPPGGQAVFPRQMVAIRIRDSITMPMTLSTGQTITANVASGLLGYLVRDEGNMSLVLLLRSTGERGLCRVPNAILEIGVPNSQSRIILPRLEAAQSAAPIANHRAKHPAGKAIVNMWEDIQKNKTFLKQYGLKVSFYDMILEDPQEKQKALNAILASFSPDVWAVLNSPNFTLKKLLELTEINDQWPKLIPDKQALIYLRIYTNGPNAADFGKYVGRTTREFPIVRMREHQDNQRNPAKLGTHYREARRHTFQRSFPMMVLQDCSPEVLPMAEMTLCSLLRTWNPLLTQVTHEAMREGASSADLEHRILMAGLSRITDSALGRANFPLFGGNGCNWSCPLQELVSSRREWLRYRVTTQDQRQMLVYRCHSHVARLHENTRELMGLRLKFIGQYHGGSDQAPEIFHIRHRLEGLPGIRPGLPLIISIELMEDGKPHPTPWYRHPHHGAWSNSGELHSFCIKAEWMDETTQKWYTTSLQHAVVFSAFQDAPLTVTGAWRKATSILQVLHNRRYRNPPSWLQRTCHQVIRQIEYDHLNQVISFSDVPETVLDPPTEVPFEENLRSLYLAAGNEWDAMVVGEKPHENWWYREGTGKKDTGCAPCVTGYARFKRTLISGCSKRDQNFEILLDESSESDDSDESSESDESDESSESDDPDDSDEGLSKRQIRRMTCKLCWTYWRRPCCWLPPKFGIEKGQVYDPNTYQLPEAYTGLVVAPLKKLVAKEIQAPMTIDEYYSIAEDMVIDPNETVAGADD
ncbi:hypothetical protein FGADI_10176 [Fusarium gaditjirri]|uniref:Uncharacterized protein n=1 Tax=Fusarium gaditjirri TaxID=282569 RepID=A0A8H4SXS9_9HYPO|nr:hypothetical protein FGADI_10176 [Fusarium gaditjirri]